MKVQVREYDRAPIEIVASRLSAPILTFVGPGNAWRLEEPYAYADGDHAITVPEGFLFDLASIPRAFWWLVSPFELSIAAPLLHDFLYQHAGVPPAGSIKPPRTYSRSEADRLFLHMMETEGVPGWRRGPAYAAVRAFGWLGWRKAS
ncbi:MAG: DUF1353 domain-containing protein [Actinomycetota bacterium]